MVLIPERKRSPIRVEVAEATNFNSIAAERNLASKLAIASADPECNL